MFYTNRRANAVTCRSGLGARHAIGIAESPDGAALVILRQAKIEPRRKWAIADPTWWAPDVILGADGVHHMFLTVGARRVRRLAPSAQNRAFHERRLAQLDLARPFTLAKDG